MSSSIDGVPQEKLGLSRRGFLRIGALAAAGAAAGGVLIPNSQLSAQETPNGSVPVRTVSTISVNNLSRRPLDFSSLRIDNNITEIKDLKQVVLEMMDLTEKQSKEIKFPKDFPSREKYAHNIATSIVRSPNKTQIQNIEEYFNRLDWAIHTKTISTDVLESICKKPNQMAISNGIFQMINSKPKNPRKFFTSVLEYATKINRGSSATLKDISELVAKE